MILRVSTASRGDNPGLEDKLTLRGRGGGQESDLSMSARRSFRSNTWAACLLAALLPVPYAHAQGGAGWMKVPAANVEGLEEPVARQLESLRQLVEARVADESATAGELAEAIGELGRHYHAYDLREPAEECYTIARRLAPGDFRWPYLLGHLYQTGGRLEQAVEQYQRALAIVPEVPPALIRLGRTLLDLNRTEEAEKALLRALELDSSAAAALASLGQLYLSAGRHAEAVEALERALELESGADLLYYPLGQAYRALGEMDKAREALARRGEIGVRPADPVIDDLDRLTTGERVHLLRGRAAFDAQRYAEAAEEFRRAVAADPESVRARVNLAAALAEAGDVDAAIAELERVVEIAPGNGTALFNLGSLHERRGELDRAAERFAEAASYEPRDPEIRLRLGDALRRLGRLEEALPHYGKAVALDASAETAWVGEADTLARLGRFEEAITRLETAHQLMPTAGLVAHALARILAASPDSALRDGARALDLALRVAEALPALGHVETVAMAYAELGRCAEAAEWQARAVEGAPEAGQPARVPELRASLERYQAGAPCRPPAAAELEP